MTVPTVPEVGGNFSALLSMAHPQPLYVPQGFRAPQGCSTPAPGNPWPGNIIPKSCFSATSAKLLSYVPAPSTSGLSNWGFSIDHHLTDSQQLHLSFWRDKYMYTFCCSNNAHFGNELGGATNEPRLGTGLFITYSNQLTRNLAMTAGFGGMGEINDGFNRFMGVSLPSVQEGTVLPTSRKLRRGITRRRPRFNVSFGGCRFGVSPPHTGKPSAELLRRFVYSRRLEDSDVPVLTVRVRTGIALKLMQRACSIELGGSERRTGRQ